MSSGTLNSTHSLTLKERKRRCTTVNMSAVDVSFVDVELEHLTFVAC